MVSIKVQQKLATGNYTNHGKYFTCLTGYSPHHIVLDANLCEVWILIALVHSFKILMKPIFVDNKRRLLILILSLICIVILK